MASNEKKTRFEFTPWAGVPYVVDATMKPDTFYWDPNIRAFHIGEGTDLQLRLFWLNLTPADRQFLNHLHIACDDQ